MSIPVMYNVCFGGFGLSAAAMAEYRHRCPEVAEDLPDFRIARHDPVMVAIVEEMGAAASDRYASVRIARIPAQYVNHYEIAEYDGMESVVLCKERFKLDAVRAILGDRVSSKAEKLARIAAVVNNDDGVGDEITCHGWVTHNELYNV
jgi:hypothetical protein